MTGRATMTAAPRDEQGSAALIVLGLVGVLVTVTLAGLVVGALLTGQRRAAAAADLAALAAADSVVSSTPVLSTSAPCEEAAKIGVANGARLVSCTVEGDEVTVAVVVSVPVLMGADVAVSGRARAGPVS